LIDRIIPAMQKSTVSLLLHMGGGACLGKGSSLLRRDSIEQHSHLDARQRREHLPPAQRIHGSAPYGARSRIEWNDARRARTPHRCRHAQRDVYRFESLDPKGPITSLPTSTRQAAQQPNDVVYKSDGSLYFTDPPYGLRTQLDSDLKSSSASTAFFAFPTRSNTSQAHRRS